MSRLHGREGSSIPLCCALLGFTKQAYYKHMSQCSQRALEEDLVLREVVSIRNELPCLGGRKLYSLICRRLPRGVCPGRDGFFRLLSVNGLLLRKPRRPHPVTTVSWHRFHKFSNLWKGRIPDGPDRVWVADITYVRKDDGTFLYLSLLTDAYSHKIVGWHLSDSLDMQGPVSALETALEHLPAVHSLMHHSDRGVQYCSGRYVSLLREHGIQISMTENGDPRENAVAERVNGILKEEWLNRESIDSLEGGREVVARVVGLYNSKRPHLSNDYLTPEQAHNMQGPLKRRWKTYYKKKEYVDNIEENEVSLSPKPAVACGDIPAGNRWQD